MMERRGFFKRLFEGAAVAAVAPAALANSKPGPGEIVKVADVQVSNYGRGEFLDTCFTAPVVPDFRSYGGRPWDE